MSAAKEQGAVARRHNIARDANPYGYSMPTPRAEWYEGWDEQHLVSAASTGGSTWNTGNLPGG